MRYSSIFFATAAVVIIACENDRDVEQVGSAQFSLRTMAASGTEYELSNAVFDLQGPQAQQVSGDAEVEVINVDLDPGAYTSTLQDGWVVRRRELDGTWTNVDATMLHSPVVEFTIIAGAVTSIVYRFGVGDEFIEFGKGRVGIGVEIVEGSGGTGSGGSGGTASCSGGPIPNAVEFPGNGVDDDCDGQIDESAAACDQGLTLATNDPVDAARALGICEMSLGGTPGLVSATWVLPDGTPAAPTQNFHLGHGVLNSFGANVAPREGGRLLALSSGTARRPSDPGYVPPANGFDKSYSSNFPAGFPKESPACPGVITEQPHDGIALSVVLRVPSNAGGFAYSSKFYSAEWPQFVCSEYNDAFVALLAPIPVGLSDGNIAFDANGNVVSVNSGFLNVCDPSVLPGYPCSAGQNELQGTGFQTHAATTWLSTQAPATPGSEITLRFAIYDSGDGIFDSTVLLDDFVWLPSATTGSTQDP